MTVRGCVLGNSHIAALRIGWDQIGGDFPDVKLDFYGSPRERLRHTTVENGKLVATAENVADDLAKTGGSDKIDLSLYDFFCIVGCGANSRIVLRMQAHHVTYGYKLADEMYISEAYLRDCYETHLRGTASKHLAEKLSGATNARVFVVPDPHLANDDGPDRFKGRDFVAAAQRRKSLEFSDKVFSDTFTKVFSGANVVFQDPETLDGPLMTNKVYSRGGLALEHVGLGGEEEEARADIVHVNAEYGKKFWRNFFDTNVFA
jgi:hypothetical protein